MRSDYLTLREVVDGFSASGAGPTCDGLAGLRPRPPLHCEVPGAWSASDDARGTGTAGPYLHDLRQTFERRSSSTVYAPEPLEAGPVLASVRDALAEDLSTWGEDGEVGSLEPFVLLLRPRGAQPGLYRVGLEGADLVHGLPGGDEAGGMVEDMVEGMTVQKELTQAGAIVSVAANLDQADTWAGAHGYRHVMGRSAALVYSVHLRSTARGLAGTVFAGFSSSAVRALLGSDGVSRHQMFAVTVAVPGRQT